MIEEKYLYSDETDRIIGCFYAVYNTLRYGFLEKVYENALKHELEKSGFEVVSQKKIDVLYDNIRVGEYFADLVVDNKVIIEIKAAEDLCIEHTYQLLNYLRATNMEVGLLLNFGKKPKVIRKTFLKQDKESYKSCRS